MVDVENEWLPLIPQEIRKVAVRKTHRCWLKAYPPRQEECILQEDETRELLRIYRENARLIITPRIHCAMPCLAMGIPVVFLCRNTNDERFSVIKHFLHAWLPAEAAKVNWSPEPLEFEDLKKAMIQNAVRRMEAAGKGEVLSAEESQKLIDAVQQAFADVKARYAPE